MGDVNKVIPALIEALKARGREPATLAASCQPLRSRGRNWAGNQRCAPAGIARPTSEELVGVVERRPRRGGR